MTKFNYETWWEDYTEINKLDPGTKLRKKLIAREIADKRFRKILDLGCGTGELIEELKTKFPKKELHGTDVSKLGLKILEEKKITKSTFILDLEKNSSINEIFDVVICSEVIEHLKNWKNAIAAADSATKQGGKVIITTQSGKRYAHHLAIGHLQHFELSQITRELEKHGFKILEAKRLGWPFMNLKNILVTKFMVDESYKSGNISFLQTFGLNLFYYLYQINLGSSGPQIFIVAEKS